MVNISVSDNGIGIGYLKERDQHFGIGIMHERASKLAGTVVFSSNDTHTNSKGITEQLDQEQPDVPLASNNKSNLSQGTKVTLIFPSQQEPTHG